MVKAQYIRFVLDTEHSDSGVAEGIMRVAYEIAENPMTSNEDQVNILALLRWFSDNLPTPTRFNKTTSKGAYRRATKGVSWFKASANEHIDKMGALAALVEGAGFQTQRVRSQRPGYVVYEDEIQIVAEPFREKRTRPTRRPPSPPAR